MQSDAANCLANLLNSPSSQSACTIEERLFRLAKGMLRDIDAVEECLQDSYLAMLSQPLNEYVEKYVHTVVRNRARCILGERNTRRVRSQAFDEAMHVVVPEEPVLETESDVAELRRAYQKHVRGKHGSPVSDQVCDQFFLECLAPAEIVAKLGVPESSVYHYIGRAKSAVLRFCNER